MRTLWIALTVLMLAGSPVAAQDETYRRIIADRDQFKRVIHLFGDSISRGWALRTFPDVASDDIKASKAWPLRSPAAMVNLLINEAGLGGEQVAAFAGPIGFPDDSAVRSHAQRLAKLVADQVIRPGDLIVMEDAGLHPRDPDIYEHQWRLLLTSVAASRAKVALVDMFDYITDTHIGRDPADAYRFSVAFRGGATGAMRSHNEATAAAAKSFGVALIHLRNRMDHYRSVALERFGVDPIHPDGIHPNIWGQCVVAAAVAEAANLPTEPNASFTQAFVRAEPALSRAAVNELVASCLAPQPRMAAQ